MFYKPEIRDVLISRRKNLNSIFQVQAAQGVIAQIVYLKPFLESQHIAIYISVHGELNTAPLIHCAEILNKNLYLPFLPPKRSDHAKILKFYPYCTGDNLITNSHGIVQPDFLHKVAINPHELDLIIVPLVGFDRQGNRVGRGAGHYDRTLAFIQDLPKNKRPFLMGIAYEFQKIAKITPSSWDIPLDMIVTEQNLYVCNRSGG